MPDEHKPTDEQRAQVTALIISGATRQVICDIIGVTQKTLLLRYPEEVQHASARATARIASTLYRAALHADTDPKYLAAAIFWMKTQANWNETSKVELAVEFNSEEAREQLRQKLHTISDRVAADIEEAYDAGISGAESIDR